MLDLERQGTSGVVQVLTDNVMKERNKDRKCIVKELEEKLGQFSILCCVLVLPLSSIPVYYFVLCACTSVILHPVYQVYYTCLDLPGRHK